VVYWAQEDNLVNTLHRYAPYLQQQVGGSGCGSGAPGAGVFRPGGGVPPARAQRRGLQDVAAPAVVPETAVVQVHGQAAGLEVERHWEEERNNNNNTGGTVCDTTQHNAPPPDDTRMKSSHVLKLKFLSYRREL